MLVCVYEGFVRTRLTVLISLAWSYNGHVLQQLAAAFLMTLEKYCVAYLTTPHISVHGCNLRTVSLPLTIIRTIGNPTRDLHKITSLIWERLHQAPA